MDVVQKVVLQGFRDVDELLHANVITFKNRIHVWPCAIDATGKLGDAYSFFVKYLLDKVSDVHSVWFGHELLFYFVLKQQMY